MSRKHRHRGSKNAQAALEQDIGTGACDIDHETRSSGCVDGDCFAVKPSGARQMYAYEAHEN
eukprot:6176930-Pleurochrysis_carterae.AAC.2